MTRATPKSDVILVVDDDDALRDTLCEVLAEAGYGVAAARDGLEALRLLRGSHRTSLVLLDLMMPGMSGYAFLELRADDADLASVPVVVMSASTWGRELAGIEFLEKPFAISSLLSIAARHCGTEGRGRVS